MSSTTQISPSAVAECCFVDVRQGSCNVILLGNRRAIVVDCGPRGSRAPFRLLDQFGVETIVALIISHNHSDHCGGAELLLSKYRGEIGHIYFLDDGPIEENVFFARIEQERKLGFPEDRIHRVEAPKIIYEDIKRELRLRVLFPEFSRNLSAKLAGKKNETSGVLVLECGKRKILFPADIQFEQWKWLSRKGRIRCDIMAVPHHGGALKTGDAKTALKWIYESAVTCGVAIVSVGTSNRYNHPDPDHISALACSGASVMCTQITGHCCDDLERLRPGVLPPRLSGESLSVSVFTSSAKRSKNVACAGTILVEIASDNVIVQRYDDHYGAVTALHASETGHPLCRPGSTAQPSVRHR